MGDEKILRCAAYTRKSHEDGLEQEFNSLDAQREAAENYIASQKANGWEILPEKYDDGGFSGGNMERPALKRLLADVKAGKVDIIVVYKLDRLSRSLLDFMKLAEMLEQYNVSFVSVTQDINTSTSAGRMMLNILMTFAQYEREILAERIRDKIAGAKRRGKHCGGPPLLGYDVNPDTKKLLVNKEDAKIIRLIFQRYIELGSARDVAKELNRKGLKSKTWKSKKGRLHKGGVFTPAMIYRTLANSIYAGMVHHNDKVFPGEHKAIIDQKLWDKVKSLMETNRNSRGFVKKEIESPFKGLLKCGYCGGALGITYTQKKDRRYTYYVCIKNESKAENNCPLARVPTGEIDRVILNQLSSIFRSPTLLANTYATARKQEFEEINNLRERKKELVLEQEKIRQAIIEEDVGDLAELTKKLKNMGKEIDEIERELINFESLEISNHDISEAFGSIDTLWGELFPAERYRLAHLLIEKIIVLKDKLKMEIKTHGMTSLVRELQAEDFAQINVQDSSLQTISIDIPIRIKRKCGRKVIIAPDMENGEKDAVSPLQDSLVKNLARAHAWMEILETGEVATATQLAEKLSFDKSYVGRILRLVNLAPEIQEAIISGNEPDGLSMNKLRGFIPADWQEQKEIFGFKEVQ
jgi:site-specific DNA recombinase